MKYAFNPPLSLDGNVISQMLKLEILPSNSDIGLTVAAILDKHIRSKIIEKGPVPKALTAVEVNRKRDGYDIIFHLQYHDGAIAKSGYSVEEASSRISPCEDIYE